MPKRLFDKCQELSDHINTPVLLLELNELTVQCLLAAKRTFGKRRFPKIAVVLNTPGGDVDAAFVITKLIRKHADQNMFLIPLYAKSAGTLMCLGADELIMTEISELGPLDSQVREEQEGGPARFNSALNGFKALEQIQAHNTLTVEVAARMIRRGGMRVIDAYSLAIKFAGETSGTLYAQLDPKKMGEYARALEIGEKYGNLILDRFMGWPKEKARSAVQRLVRDYPSHGFVLDVEEVADVGLPAKLPGDKKVEELMDEMRDIFIQLDEENRIRLFEPVPVTPTTPVTP